MFNYYYSCRFVGNLLEKDRVKKFITRWKFSITPSPFMMNMRTLDYQPDFELISPNGPSKIERNFLKKEYDFRDRVLQHRMNQFQSLKNWVVFCPQNCTEKAVQILTDLSTTGSHFKYFDSKPQCFFVDSESDKAWLEGFEKQIDSNFEFILCFTTRETSQICNNLLKSMEKLGIKNGIPSYFVNPNKIESPNVVSSHELLMKMAAAKGDHPWVISQLVENSPTVIAAVNLFQVGDKVAVILLLSKNRFFTKYIQKSILVSGTTESERNEQLNGFF